VKPAQQRDRAGFLTSTFKISARRACRLLKINKSTYYYKSTTSALNVAPAARIKEIATVRVRYGYPRIHVLLRREGFDVNRKRVYRLYAHQGLNLRAKIPYRKRAAVPRAERIIAPKPNNIWAMDFMHERLADGSKIRLLTFRSPDVVRVLTHACIWNDVKLDFSRPDKPTDNAFCESFKDRVRAEFLNPSYFESLSQATRAAGIWRQEYNEFRPHSTLRILTPAAYARAALARRAS